MKILFIGGTGLISSAVSPLVLSQGHELFLLNRGTKKLDGAHTIVADIHDEAAVAKALRGMTFDAVVNWIAYSPADVERDFRLFSNITRQYFFISSASAYTKPVRHHPITESAPVGNTLWNYAQSKADCERILFDHMQRDGFPVTVVRPSHTYGGDKLVVPLSGASTQWTYAERMLRGAPTVVHGDGTSLWTVTHNTDFAKALVGLLGNTQAVGHAFHITSDEALTWNRIVEIQCKLLGVTPNIVHIASDYIAKKLPQYRGPLLGDKSESALFDNTKIKTFVPSFICTTPFSRGAQLSVQSVLAGPREVDRHYNETVDTLYRDYLKL